MKEIIYLDNELVNSYLAQYERGLVNKTTTSTGSSETDCEDISNTASATGGIKIPGLADLSSEVVTTISSGSTFSQENLESLEVAFHDYALDKLLNYIEIDESYKEGGFILTHDKMSLYNFTRLENLMQQDIVLAFDEDLQHNEKIYNQINIIKQSSGYKTFDAVRRLGKIGNALFPESCLIKINKFLCICPKNNLRVNEAALNLLNETTRKAHCLGVIIYKREKDYIQKEADGSTVQLPIETVTSSAPTMIMEMLLDSLELSEKGDYFVRPIAIYF